jgi:hypothetical protein
MKFKADYGVYVCTHVLNKSRPVLESVRDFDGDWQFLCGVEGCMEEDEPHHIGVGHLVARDSSIDKLTVLEPGMYAGRKNENERWEFGRLNE